MEHAASATLMDTPIVLMNTNVRKGKAYTVAIESKAPELILKKKRVNIPKR